MLRSYRVIGSPALLAALALTGLVAFAVARVGFTGAEDETLAIVLAGIEDAGSTISSGKGKLQTTFYEPLSDTGVLHMKTDVEYYFTGNTYHSIRATTFIRNDVPNAGPFRAPGSVLRKETAYDGVQETELRQIDNTAVIRETPDPGVGYKFIVRHACGLTAGFPLESIPWMISEGLHVARTETFDGDECIVLEVSVPSLIKKKDGSTSTYTHEYWVAPAKGYAVRRSCMYITGGIWKHTMWSDYRLEVEPMGDRWRPAKYVETHYSVIPETGEHRVSYTKTLVFDPEFQFNVPVSAEELKVKIPSGTYVRDEVTGMSYTQE